MEEKLKELAPVEIKILLGKISTGHFFCGDSAYKNEDHHLAYELKLPKPDRCLFYKDYWMIGGVFDYWLIPTVNNNKSIIRGSYDQYALFVPYSQLTNAVSKFTKPLDPEPKYFDPKEYDKIIDKDKQRKINAISEIVAILFNLPD